MSGIKCSSPGCTEILWQEIQGKLQSTQSNALCMNCRQTFYCFPHFLSAWHHKVLPCPQCKHHAWQVSIRPPLLLPANIRTAILSNGGKIREEKEKAPSSQPAQHFESASRQKEINRAFAASPKDPFDEVQALNQNAKNFLNQYAPIESKPKIQYTSAYQNTEERPTHQQLPKQWTLIYQSDLPTHAYPIGQGLAIARDNQHSCTIMDNERVLRTLEVEGHILDVTQSPRKRRVIVFRQMEDQGLTDMLWLNGKEVRGFISNPYDMNEQVFGATFLNDLSFTYFVVRPDQRVELREAKFNKNNQIQSRLVGKSYLDVPMSAVDCEKGQRVFLIAQKEDGFWPICRRIADGKDMTMGDLLYEKPRRITAAKNVNQVAWIDQDGYVYLSGAHIQAIRVGESDGHLLALSDDGNSLAWESDDRLFIYDLNTQRIQHWTVPPLLAISWKGDF